jgi:hypothetical protein
MTKEIDFVSGLREKLETILNELIKDCWIIKNWEKKSVPIWLEKSCKR